MHVAEPRGGPAHDRWRSTPRRRPPYIPGWLSDHRSVRLDHRSPRADRHVDSRVPRRPTGAAYRRWSRKVGREDPQPAIPRRQARDQTGAKVTVLGLEDPKFEKDLRDRTSDISRRMRKDTESVFLSAQRTGDLARRSRCRANLAQDGGAPGHHASRCAENGENGGSRGRQDRQVLSVTHGTQIRDPVG